MDTLSQVRGAFQHFRLILASERLQRFLESSVFVRLLVVVYSVGFTIFSAVRYFGLQTFAWDMGVYNQAIYTTVFGGKLLYYTADLPANTSGSLLGVHFSPILLALTPFYLPYPSPVTLLAIQAVALGLGALPLYYYAVDKLQERRTPAVFSVAYLLSPMIVGINWFDFHPEAFLPAALLGALYFSSKRKWLAYFVCILIALASIETASIIVAALGSYLLWEERHNIAKMRLGLIARSSVLRASVTTVLLSAAWLHVALTTIRAFNPINVFYFGGTHLYWRVLGARTVLEVPVRVLTDPGAAISALAVDWWVKIVYIVVLFAPLLFLPFRSLPITLLTVPWLGVALFSNYQPFYFWFNQYPSFVAPFIFVGAVQGLAKLGPCGKHLRFSPNGLKRYLTVASLVAFAAATPVIPWFLGFPFPPPYQVFSAGSHESSIRELITLVPPNASVLTQSNIFPLVSSRVDAYVVPTVSFFPPGTSFNATFDQWLNASDYVLLDPVTDQISSLLTLHRLRIVAVHGLFAQVQDIMLFRKSYTGFPVRYEPRIVALDWKTLELLNTRLVSDPKSISGNVLYHDTVSTSPFWDSTQVWLPAGSFEAVLRVRTDSNFAGSLIRVNLTTYSVTVLSSPIGDQQTGFNYKFSVTSAVENVSSMMFNSTSDLSNSYRDFAISFRADGLQSFSFSGHALTNLTGIYLDRILVEQRGTSS